MKAEIRAAQRLLLEVAEGARHVSPEQLVAAVAEVPEALPALPGLGMGGELQLDVGTLTSHQDVVERHHNVSVLSSSSYMKAFHTRPNFSLLPTTLKQDQKRKQPSNIWIHNLNPQHKHKNSTLNRISGGGRSRL